MTCPSTCATRVNYVSTIATGFGGAHADMATYQGLSALSRGIMGTKMVNHDMRAGAEAMQTVAAKISGKEYQEPVVLAKKIVRGLQSTSADTKTPASVVDVFADGQGPIDHVAQEAQGFQQAVQAQQAPYALPVHRDRQQAYQQYANHPAPALLPLQQQAAYQRFARHGPAQAL